MDFIKTTVKGMAERLPSEMALRDYVIREIKDTYKTFGFMLIETPIVEHIENLSSKQGGENESLIFKIMKRGDKLEKSQSVDDMVDSGLRYDLTLPLSRFYANNVEKLPMPFKSLQIGDVFRADRPQKGRFREFTQCDIDILGDESNLAEIELISATVSMLNKLGIDKLRVRVNDRRILKAMALSCGFDECKLDEIFIILDKMDKIGLDGVKGELIKLDLPFESVEKYCAFFEHDGNLTLDELGANVSTLDDGVIGNLKQIIETADALTGEGSKIEFDATLVRGMSYYTGTIFEIELAEFNSSVAGGGRYDKMVGKFLGKDVCACGFSIGFERIISVITENKLIQLEGGEKTAVLLAKDLTNERKLEVIKRANVLRRQGKVVSVVQMNKNVKYQKEMLASCGFTNIIDIFNDKGCL